MRNETITNVSFFKIGNELKNSWISVKNYQGAINTYRAGIKTYDIFANSSPLYGCDTLDYKLQIKMDFNEYAQWGYISTKDLACFNRKKVSLAPGETTLLPNVFYILTKEHMQDKLLKGLNYVRFE